MGVCPTNPNVLCGFAEGIRLCSSRSCGVCSGGPRPFAGPWSRSLVRSAGYQDLQHSLGRFAAEYEAAGMRISTSKSEAMVLSRKRVVCPLQVGGEFLSQVEEFLYLEAADMSFLRRVSGRSRRDEELGHSGGAQSRAAAPLHREGQLRWIGLLFRMPPGRLPGRVPPAAVCYPREEKRGMSAQANRVMALSEWEDRWKEGKIGFHRTEVHKLLENNLDKVVCGRKEIRFFFPLCGKSVDMKWLADMGHTVVGVEISQKGIKQFFEEQDLAYNEEAVPAIPEAKLFKSADGKISIYQCDLFKFSSAVAGKFGGIWDRGGLVAINPCDREKYGSLLVSLMNNDCRYLVDTVEYNPEPYKGAHCIIELVQAIDGFEERHKAWGLDSLTEKVHLLSPKAQ
ncbi:unnamed protein product [Leuciscus chuanchicus]